MAFAAPSETGPPSSTAYPNHVVEQALAHTISNAVEAAYRRGDLFEKRRHLMNDWAEFCERREYHDVHTFRSFLRLRRRSGSKHTQRLL